MTTATHANGATHGGVGYVPPGLLSPDLKRAAAYYACTSSSFAERFKATLDEEAHFRPEKVAWTLFVAGCAIHGAGAVQAEQAMRDRMNAGTSNEADVRGALDILRASHPDEQTVAGSSHRWRGDGCSTRP